MRSFGVTMTFICLWAGFLDALAVSLVSAWLMMTARVYSNDPKETEKSKRMIEAYSRVCVIHAFLTGLFGVALYVMYMKYEGCL